MRYLLCFIFPPVAVAATGRPLTALLNLVLTCCLIVPGLVHALIIVHSHDTERRHAETLSAVTGRPVAVRKSAEWPAFALITITALLLLCVGLWWVQSQQARTDAARQAQTRQAAQAAADEARRAEMQVQAQAAMEGRSLAEIEGTHGAALSRDKVSGWAKWPKFRARFEAGKAVEIETR